jgi:predicted N-acyltransferase
MPGYSIRVTGSVTSIDKASWNAGAAASSPFLSWEFLALLEDSGAVGGARSGARGGARGENPGWSPAHAVLEQGGEPVAFIPLFVLSGSMGSFVWDDGMEDVAAAAGLRWYPKLAGTVPFTPAPVWRPIVVPGHDEAEVLAACGSALAELARRGGFSGVHLHWSDPALAPVFGGGQDGWIEWKRQVYHWDNDGYRSFDDFMAAFSKNMRRNVARDKADVAGSGITVKVIRGDEAGQAVWDLMADLYGRTNDKFGPWAARFLPRRFFELAPEYIGRAVRFSAAYENGADTPMALAMLFQGRDTLWGRYWGTERDLRGLHFETCYYAPIEYAIREGLSCFDPGMGSEHKARRGFRSSLASSYHKVFDQRLHRVFASALAEASAAETRMAGALNEELPFKSASSSPRPS